MSSMLLLITLGPVQDFIAQARRTRDLWFGSHLLSEVSKAAARVVRAGSDLVFPTFEDAEQDLAPSSAPVNADGSTVAAAPNHVLAVTQGDAACETLARAAREAAAQRLRELAEPVWKACRPILDEADGTRATWDEQLDTLLEFHAAWAPIGDDYQAARHVVEDAIASQKALRNFAPWTRQRGRRPKSSLDGARETVLRRATGRPPARHRETERRFRIDPREELDAVGLVKRAGGEPERIVPLGNIAAAPWILAAQAVPGGREAIDSLRRACREASISGTTRSLEWVRVFPYDAQILLESRWAPMLAESLGLDALAARAWGRDHVRPLHSAMAAAGMPPAPHSYVACVVADGDRVGRTLDDLAAGKPPVEAVTAHQRFSRSLAAFAAEARRVVESAHHGMLVYSGGDDVLGFVPVAEALQAAQALRDAFVRIVGQPVHDAPTVPTLSVGICVGHVLESMGFLLEQAREAERLAKRSRNSLAIRVVPRSGSEVEWTDAWTNHPARRLQEDVALLDGPLPTKKIYEVRRDLGRFPMAEEVHGRGDPSAHEVGSGWAAALARDTIRTLSRVDGRTVIDPALLGMDELSNEPLVYSVVRRHIERWTSRMLCASALAEGRTRRREREGSHA